MTKRRKGTLIPNGPSPQVRQTAIVAQSQLRIAPLPKPEELAHYEAVLPGAGERIMRMAEENGRDRRLNNRALRVTMILGQVFAFALMMTALLGSFYLLSLGHNVAGLAGVIAAIAAPLGVFVYREKQSRQGS